MATPDERLEELIESLGAEAARGAPVAHDGVPQGRHRPGRTQPLSLPSSLRGARLGVGGPVLRGMVVLVVVVAVVLGVRVAWAERSATPHPVTATGHEDAAGGTAPASSAPGSSQAVDVGEPSESVTVPTTTPPEVVVHVIGAVREPGVVSVAPGSRVQDAVEAAGGLRDDADLTRLNLARPAVDGERLWVPVPGEEPPPELPAPQSVAPPTMPSAGASDGAAGDGPVDLNTADQAELETLPGVGPVTAERILQWRAEHGSFTAVEELMEVSGIGERTLEQLRPHVGLGR